MKAIWSKLSSTLTHTAFWRARNESERRTLVIAALILLLMLAFQFVYKPITTSVKVLRSQTQQQAQQIASLRVQIAARKQSLAMQPSVNVPSVSDSMSLPAVLEGALTEAGFKSALKKIEPLSDASVRVELGGVNFDALVTTLELLAKNKRVTVKELSLDAIAPSTVSARITFSR